MKVGFVSNTERVTGTKNSSTMYVHSHPDQQPKQHTGNNRAVHSLLKAGVILYEKYNTGFIVMGMNWEQMLSEIWINISVKGRSNIIAQMQKVLCYTEITHCDRTMLSLYLFSVANKGSIMSCLLNAKQDLWGTQAAKPECLFLCINLGGTFPHMSWKHPVCKCRCLAFSCLLLLLQKICQV